MTGDESAFKISVNVLRLLTFGGLALQTGDGSLLSRVRPQRLAILAMLASAGDRGVSRDRLAGVFWPETGEDRARHSLRQALYALRQELGADVVRSDAVLALDRSAIDSDVGDFRAAVAAGERERAATLVTGPFLQGFYLPSSPEFERWVEEERGALAAETSRVLLGLARGAESAGDHDAATEWWRRLTTVDPLSGRNALGYLKALAARGDRAGALAFARAHEEVVRRELETDLDPEIRRLEAELRALPTPPVPRVRVPATAGHVAQRDVDAVAPSPADTPVPRAHAADLPTARHDLRPTVWRRFPMAAALAAGVVLLGLVLGVWDRVARDRAGETGPVFAVGMIREDGVPDTLRIGGVLTDMLATNLARVAGLTVLANTRLFELMLPGQDTLATGYVEAAKRAGATDILQGQLLSGPQWSLAMEVQRVDLRTGLVTGGYRVVARDRYELVDSMTAVIARDLRLRMPTGSVADATTDSPLAYRFYEEGLRAYYQYDNSAARRLMRAALAEDSTMAMAAYYAAVLDLGRDEEVWSRRRALALAARAPERERLTISADLLTEDNDPSAAAVAESLVTRYPTDPRGFEMLAKALTWRGEWPRAVAAIERAVAIDSAAEPAGRQQCRLCWDLNRLAEIYLWWDSLPAAERTARRWLRLRPNDHMPWHFLLRSAAARGDVMGARAYLRRVRGANPFETAESYGLRFAVLSEDHEEVERLVPLVMGSPKDGEALEGRWFWMIALRNLGRLEEALRLARGDPVRDHLVEAVVMLERGNGRRAAALFDSSYVGSRAGWPAARVARYYSWQATRIGMALAAAGDTAAVRRLADTAEYWGQQSGYGRDRVSHHFLRGLLLVAAGRDAEAVERFQQAIHSPTHGFTRVNYEMGKALLRLNRAAEAASVVRSALHGDIDGSNLYVTRTELHELLGQAFAQLGMRDSAAVHYRAVVRAWERADPPYRQRRDQAREWLARNAAVAPAMTAPRAESPRVDTSVFARAWSDRVHGPNWFDEALTPP